MAWKFCALLIIYVQKNKIEKESDLEVPWCIDMTKPPPPSQLQPVIILSNRTGDSGPSDVGSAVLKRCSAHGSGEKETAASNQHQCDKMVNDASGMKYSFQSNQ